MRFEVPIILHFTWWITFTDNQPDSTNKGLNPDNIEYFVWKLEINLENNKKETTYSLSN